MFKPIFRSVLTVKFAWRSHPDVTSIWLINFPLCSCGNNVEVEAKEMGERWHQFESFGNISSVLSNQASRRQSHVGWPSQPLCYRQFWATNLLQMAASEVKTAEQQLSKKGLSWWWLITPVAVLVSVPITDESVGSCSSMPLKRQKWSWKNMKTVRSINHAFSRNLPSRALFITRFFLCCIYHSVFKNHVTTLSQDHLSHVLSQCLSTIMW